VEIMGSEGYLINQFLAAATNQRDDAWGGAYEQRMRFPVEVVRRIRAAVGPDFILIFRLSMIDLVPGGSTWAEVVQLAKALEAAGATLINTGIGWHEARVPTIATSVPRAAFAWLSKKIKAELSIPVITSNRINTPETGEVLLSEGYADMVSMARPLLADPDFVRKAREGRADEINTCIACNQACLDHIFANKPASCLVNPRAGHETTLRILPVHSAPPGGGGCRPGRAGRRHHAGRARPRGAPLRSGQEIGGQLNLAKQVPGKEEFHEMLRYWRRRLEVTGVYVHLGRRVQPEHLVHDGFREVVLATGVLPRNPRIPGQEHPKVLSYLDVLTGAPVGDRVAIIGAGGIGFDVAEYLSQSGKSSALDLPAWLAEWGSPTLPWPAAA
jgi:2,4-dienoyl-CoA reductase (NADPH2)